MALSNERTQMLQILIDCRKGLDVRDGDVPATHYTAQGLTMLFKYTDGKLYRLVISPVDMTPQAGIFTESEKT